MASKALHQNAVKDDLAKLPALYEDCFHAISRRRSPAIFMTRVRTSRNPDPFNDEAIEVRRHIDDVLRSWAALVAERVGLPVPGPDRGAGIGGLTAFLVAHLDWLMRSAAATEFAEEVAALRGRAERLVNGTAPAHHLGECVEASCDGRLTARTAPGRAVASQIGCDRGHSWPPREWLLLSARIERREAS
ncbi:hypothetical protein RND61_22505 [Streptomyces sp. TRM76323]|uniref:TetR family transcriptional regulator n=1 Tax=Streptomyces tamarix TaxID=3078565 RepID=A0ABU3QQN7_9ACTN|nr:hypothetical protein [Streptomyces tamarix]MDT9684808.1 hypothetical protein [Streptomyces tamarix]